MRATATRLEAMRGEGEIPPCTSPGLPTRMPELRLPLAIAMLEIAAVMSGFAEGHGAAFIRTGSPVRATDARSARSVPQPGRPHLSLPYVILAPPAYFGGRETAVAGVNAKLTTGARGSNMNAKRCGPLPAPDRTSPSIQWLASNSKLLHCRDAGGNTGGPSADRARHHARPSIRAGRPQTAASLTLIRSGSPDRFLCQPAVAAMFPSFRYAYVRAMRACGTR